MMFKYSPFFRSTMRRVIVISVFIFASLLFLNLAFALNPNNIANNAFSLCVKQCVNESQINHASCVANYKNISNGCKSEFKACSLAALNKTNKSIEDFKNCKKNYSSCIKQVQKTRNSCIKNNINQSRICKENCKELKQERVCSQVYFPVCGKDNKTYGNKCLLENASVKKECNGECPCIELVKNRCFPVCLKKPCYTLHSEADTFVCGWFNKNIECLKYPCAETYSNSSDACSDSKVDYWTTGECPNPIL